MEFRILGPLELVENGGHVELAGGRQRKRLAVLLVALIPVGKRPSGVATGQGSVWVANGGERTISKIDPQTNQVVDTIPTRYYPEAPAYGHGFLWVSLHDRPFNV